MLQKESSVWTFLISQQQCTRSAFSSGLLKLVQELDRVGGQPTQLYHLYHQVQWCDELGTRNFGTLAASTSMWYKSAPASAFPRRLSTCSCTRPCWGLCTFCALLWSLTAAIDNNWSLKCTATSSKTSLFRNKLLVQRSATANCRECSNRGEKLLRDRSR